jgi:tetratricopeptide (TPR) repeat protein
MLKQILKREKFNDIRPKILPIVDTMFIIASFLLGGMMSCASTQKGGIIPQEEKLSAGTSFMEAIEQSAGKIAEELPKGSRVAIVAFEAESDNLSDFIMEELTGALFDRSIEVADRQNLEILQKEFAFQMSGSVSDETVKAAGKFLAADMVIVGQLVNIGKTYRYHTNAIHMEQATRASVTRLSIRNDAEMQDIIASLANRSTMAKTAKYGVSSGKSPQTAGMYLDHGILFRDRKNYDMAIASFSQAIILQPNMAVAYLYRGLVYAIKEDHHKAVMDYNEAIGLDSNFAEAYYNRGLSQYALGALDRAINNYTNAIKRNPNYTEAYLARAISYRVRGINLGEYSTPSPQNFSRKDYYNLTVADCDQVIRLDPSNIEAYKHRARAYFAINNADPRAFADYAEAIKLDPNSYDLYIERGNIYFKKGDFDKAMADFEAARQMQPHHSFILQRIREIEKLRNK